MSESIRLRTFLQNAARSAEPVDPPVRPINGEYGYRARRLKNGSVRLAFFVLDPARDQKVSKRPRLTYDPKALEGDDDQGLLRDFVELLKGNKGFRFLMEPLAS